MKAAGTAAQAFRPPAPVTRHHARPKARITARTARSCAETLVINRGATELIIDMTGTGWCDQAGAATVARAQLRAADSGTQLRLVVTAETVRRMLTLHGLDRLIPIYPSVEAATAMEAFVIPMTPKPDSPNLPQPRKQTELS